MTNIKIFQINTNKDTGGAAQIASRLNDYLNELEEVSSEYFFGRRGGRKKGGDNKFGLISEKYLHAAITRTTGLHGYGSYFSTKKLIRLINKKKPDIVHLHNVHGYYLNLRFIEFIKQTEIPVVWTFHDAWPITGSCGYFFQCQKWKRGCGHCPDKYRYPKSYVDASAFMWKKKKQVFSEGWNPLIVTPSQWLADRVNESFLKDHKVKVIPNGIDTEKFKPRPKEEIRDSLGIPQDKKVVLFVAADLQNERKGAKYFFESLPDVNADDWMAVTMGEEVDIDSVVGEAGVEIKQLGYLSDRSEVARAYNIADLFVITALQDNLPTTVNESLASGTPVVGFRAGGIPEQVKGNTGTLVEKKDTVALAKAITELLNDNEKRRTFSENCRKRALKEYSIPKFRDRYLEVYRDVIN